jgi:cyclopropane-fatty-acyl-phospholipid synthase
MSSNNNTDEKELKNNYGNGNHTSKQSSPSLLSPSTYINPFKLASAVQSTATQYLPSQVSNALYFVKWLLGSQNNKNKDNPDLTSSNFNSATMLNNILTSGLIPDPALRMGIRYMLKDRYNEANRFNNNIEAMSKYKLDFVNNLKSLPIALAQDKANNQHYEVPASFYLKCLGSHLKYSSALFDDNISSSISLDVGELSMLNLYCERAELIDGQRVLDLGCGWGSFSLFAAPRYPNSQFIAVSNSNSQREFITKQAQLRGIKNLTVITHDVTTLTWKDLIQHCKPLNKQSNADLDLNESDLIVNKSNKKNKNKENINNNGNNDNNSNNTDLLFDRVISIEMFEHMKNYELLLGKISTFLKSNTGKLFVQIFVCKNYPYHFESDNWMAAYFFSGGTMPSHDLLFWFQKDLNILNHWGINGRHYGRTSKLWLNNMDNNKQFILNEFISIYGSAKGYELFYMWRVFYMAVEELFNFNNGNTWYVGHYLFQNKI